MASPATKNNENTAVAIFAGGCFWCMEQPFEALDGVKEVVSGYTGGKTADPSYKQVQTGQTGHSEAVRITYDPAKVSYEALLDIFWRQIDPTDAGGQFADRGSQYQSAIYYLDEAQHKAAQKSLEELAKAGPFARPIVTQILPAGPFYPAEEYHQQYYKKNASHYAAYKEGSGRAMFLKKIWRNRPATAPQCGQPGGGIRDDLRTRLSPLQYKVTQENGTEPPFENEYWNEHRDGIYVDRVTGQPLFSSKDKYDSGTGWPSFSRPIETKLLTEAMDVSAGMVRTEVRSAQAHLGHLFLDANSPSGRRYCINSAALRFIPVENLEKEGYGRFIPLFNGGKRRIVR